MIHGIWPIYKRELRAFARSTSTWVALGLLFLITGWIFADVVSVFARDSAEYLRGGAMAHTTDTGACKFCDYKAVCGGAALAAERARTKLNAASPGGPLEPQGRLNERDT